MLRWLTLSPLASCLFWTRHVTGLSFNRTIDDELGDVVTGAKPQYSPESAWNQGKTCSGCHIGTSQVDVAQTFDGTWHDATYFVDQPDIEVRANFTGTAVYVYFLVPGTFPDTSTFMNTSFFIDDEPVGQFIHPPDAAADISYRVPVYTNSALDNSEHTLLMRATGPNESLILFDYIVYTVETDSTSSLSSSQSASATGSPSPTSSSSTSHTPVAAIAGGTVGGVVVLAAIAALVFYLLRGRSPRHPRPRSLLTIGESEVRSDDRLLGTGDPGCQRPYEFPSFLPVSASIPYGDPRESKHQSQDYEPSSRDPVHISHSPPVTGSTATQQQAELLQRIRVLESQMGGMQPRRSAMTPGDAGNVTSEATMRGLQDEIAALRGSLAGLRTELADERRLAAEPLPQYEAGIY